MHQDVSARYVGQGFYKSALNCNRETEGNSLLGLSSDIGNILKASRENAKFIGAISTNDSSFVLFSTTAEGEGEIGIFDPRSEKYTALITTDDLNFFTFHPVKGVFRLRNGCERVIYFTDTFNPFRVVNLDALDNYKNPDGS